LKPGARLLVVLLAWTTFAFAGVYPSSLIGPALLILALAVAYRPSRGGRTETALKVCLVTIVLAMAVQLLPLPTNVVERLSPMTLDVARRLSLASLPRAIPLSIDFRAGVWALGVAAGIVLVFLVSGRIFETGGVRTVVRGISAGGLTLAAIALAQDATAHGLMYWHWKPIEEGAPPFGPFVDRNHFATWVILAVPLCLGYLIAHVTAHKRHDVRGATWHRSLLHALDARAIWLAASVALMLVGLVASLSRSGFAGMAVALMAASVARVWRPGASAAGRWLTVALGLALVAAAIRVQPAAIVLRVSTAGGAVQDRLAIWRETLPIVRDFWITGTGAGTFDTAMLVYQRGPAPFRINAAHNHYLQVAAEGGLLLAIPVLTAIVLLARAGMERLAADRSGMFWVKAGAVSGLAGVAVQSVWETGLTTPANGVLAAIVAAIVLHRADD
jgi:O-antigen ligase/polysaccharide polymerase Wzy-like membrane protein